MRITASTVRGIHATAATLITRDATPAEPHHLSRAVDIAIDARHGDEKPSTQLRMRRQALAAAPQWSPQWTRADLADHLTHFARQGLDLRILVGARYTDAARRIWSHGAYSAARIMPGLPSHGGLSIGGRPWLCSG
ncbi:hypothetical protein ABZ543_08220 [Streptomyces roseifaciens]